ncbi:MAG: hypothetical protein Q4C71_05615, partial [Microbacteriaceae bacterium]|nr:hypothetical protein [Microbacteriaceae bacterium]
MARQAKRGFKTPKNYDPNRGPKKAHRKGGAAGKRDEAGKKRRWTSADRAFRDEFRRDERRGGGQREERGFVGRDSRGGGRGFGRDERRGGFRNERGFERGGRDFRDERRGGERFREERRD